RAMGPCPIRSPNRPESYGNCIRDIEPIVRAQTRYYGQSFPAKSSSPPRQSSLFALLASSCTNRLDTDSSFPNLSRCAIHFKLTEVRLCSSLARRTFFQVAFAPPLQLCLAPAKALSHPRKYLPPVRPSSRGDR